MKQSKPSNYTYAVFSILSLLTVFGCGNSGRNALESLEGEEDVLTNAQAAEVIGKDCSVEDPEELKAVDAIDVLLVVDNTGSMVEEAEGIARELPRMMRAIFSGGAEGGDLPRFAVPSRGVRVGVVSGDLGASYDTGLQPPTPFGCSESGDDGILVEDFSPSGFYDSTGDGELDASCADLEAPDGERYLDFLPTDSASKTTLLENQLSCRFQPRPLSCGYQQPLEAAMKALSRSDSSDLFANASVEEQGGQEAPSGPNAGFLREDSLLVVLTLTDGDDCSTFEPRELFAANVVNEGDTEKPFSSVRSKQDLRCHDVDGRNDSEVLYQPRRYTEFFLNRRKCNEHVIFATISGVPVVTEGDESDLASVLASPAMEKEAMEEEVFGQTRFVVAPSCESPNGKAIPPTRIVQTAKDINDNGGVGFASSICDASYAPAFSSILSRIAEFMPPAS